MKEIKASKKAPKKAKRIASFKDVIGEHFVALFHDDIAVDPHNLYTLFALKAEDKSLVLDLHTGFLYLNEAETFTPVPYEAFANYLKKGGKGAGKYKHLSEKNWRDLTDKQKALAIEEYHHPAPVERMYPTDVTPPDFEAYYIKISDADGEQSVYLRNVGQEKWRVFFARSFGTHLGFDTYACSEYTLKELLSGKGRYAKSGKLDCADRLLGIDEVQYLSAFMPNVHEKKRKNALALAADDAGALEVTAYYWKEEKSVPCADENYVLGLFTALKEIARCSVELEGVRISKIRNLEDDIALSTDEEVPQADENGDENTPAQSESPTAPADETEAAPVEEAAVPQAQEQPQESSQAEELPQETLSAEAAPAEETAELLDAARREEFAQAPQEPAPEEVAADESETPEPKAETTVPKPAEEKAPRKTEKKGLFSRLKNRKAKTAEKEITAAEAQQPLQEEQPLQMPQVGQAEPAEGLNVSDNTPEQTEHPASEAVPETPSAEPQPVAAAVSFTAEEARNIIEQSPEQELLVEDDENTPAQEAETAAADESAQTESESASAEPEQVSETAPTSEATPAADDVPPEQPVEEPAAEAVQSPAQSESEAQAPAPVKVKRHSQKAKEKKQSEKAAVRYDLPQLISAYVASGKRKSHKKEITGALAAAPLIVPIHANNIEDADLVYISKQAYEMCKTKIIPFVMMDDKQALLPGDENASLREGVMVKTVLNKGKTYIPVFADFKSAKQVFGQNETFGIFTLKNISTHIAHNESVEGITVHPGTLNIKIGKDELNK